jgi:hypothetical protein
MKGGERRARAAGRDGERMEWEKEGAEISLGKQV